MVSNEQIHHEGGTLGSISFCKNPSPKLGDSAMKKNDQRPYFYVVRDDLLHPLVNGNKARKLDGLLPLLEDYLVTDVVTRGGCQSAHAAAVAVSCADRGLKSHLLLRGEQPETLTGHNLISMLYGNVTYVPRSVYARRDEMLTRHADLVAGSYGSVIHLGELFEASFMNHSFEEPNSLSMYACSAADRKKVVIIEEGARNTVALVGKIVVVLQDIIVHRFLFRHSNFEGVIRLVQYLSQNHILGNEQKVKFVVDAGTGTTAVGLGLGALCLGLPWEVTAVMLADTLDAYKKQEECLISEFCRCCALPVVDQISSVGGIVHWVERRSPRKFGNILKGEVEVCQHIAQQTGILVDPLYTLAAWELASQLSQEVDGAKVVMLHTGGTLGMFGLAQRIACTSPHAFGDSTEAKRRLGSG